MFSWLFNLFRMLFDFFSSKNKKIANDAEIELVKKDKNNLQEHSNLNEQHIEPMNLSFLEQFRTGTPKIDDLHQHHRGR